MVIISSASLGVASKGQNVFMFLNVGFAGPPPPSWEAFSSATLVAKQSFGAKRINENIRFPLKGNRDSQCFVVKYLISRCAWRADYAGSSDVYKGFGMDRWGIGALCGPVMREAPMFIRVGKVNDRNHNF